MNRQTESVLVGQEGCYSVIGPNVRVLDISGLFEELKINVQGENKGHHQKNRLTLNPFIPKLFRHFSK